MKCSLGDLFPIVVKRAIEVAFFQNLNNPWANFLIAHRYHTERYAFTVIKRLHSFAALDTVTNRMTEIEYPAKSRFFFILFNYILFDSEGTNDDLIYMTSNILVLKNTEQLLI